MSSDNPMGVITGGCNTMKDTYLNDLSESVKTDLNESYLFSNRSIAIDFDKFVKGGRLFIVGLSGSGKTTVGNQIANKYKGSVCSLDSCWAEQMRQGNVEGLTQADLDADVEKVFKCMGGQIKNARGCRIVEGINIVEPSMKKFLPKVLKEACIIMGKSQIKATIDGAFRNRKNNKKFFTAFLHRYKNNGELNKAVESFRKERLKTASEIKPLKDIL